MRERSHRSSSRIDARPAQHDADSSTPTIAERIANPAIGETLPVGTRARFTQSFGHSFSDLQIHHDASADDLARALDARAFAAGDHLFFRSGEYEPESPDGLRLLAHEAAHTFANSASSHAPSSTSPTSLDVVPSGDATERAAHEAADAVVRGETAGSAAALAGMTHASSGTLAGDVVVQRWPWDEESPESPGAGSSSSSASSGLGGMLSSIGSSVSSAAGGAFDIAKQAVSTDASNVSAASAWWDKTANMDDTRKNFETMGDALKLGVSSATSWADNATRGNAALNFAAKEAGGIANTTASMDEGVLKGVGDLSSMAGNLAAHPVDSAIGMGEGIWNGMEHTPLIGDEFKRLHGYFDIASGNEHGKYGNSLGELEQHLKIGAETNTDVDYWASIGGGRDAWANDPLAAGARTITNFAPMLMGMAEGIGGGGGGGGGEGGAETTPEATPENTPGATPEPPSISDVIENLIEKGFGYGEMGGPTRSPNTYWSNLEQPWNELNKPKDPTQNMRVGQPDQGGGNSANPKNNIRTKRGPKL